MSLTNVSRTNLFDPEFFAIPAAIKNRRRKLGNNTYAYFYDDENDQRQVTITYHGNVIAQLYYATPEYLKTDPHIEFYVWVSDAGWGTSTTRERITEILKGNGINAYASQKNFEQLLRTYKIERDKDGNFVSRHDSENYWTSRSIGYSTQRSALFGLDRNGEWNVSVPAGWDLV